MVLEIRTRLCQRLKKKQGHLGDTWFPDELFVKINGQQQYLWRAAKSDGNVIDILLQWRRDQRAADRFLRRLLRGQGKEPIRIIPKRLRAIVLPVETILPGVSHDTQQSRRYLASAPADERTTNSPIQIPPGKHSAFCRSTVSFGVCFALCDIC
jgi:transposase-like protein